MKKTKWQPDEFWFLAILVMVVGGVLGIREAVTQGHFGSSLYLTVGSLVSMCFLTVRDWLRARKQD